MPRLGEHLYRISVSPWPFWFFLLSFLLYFLPDLLLPLEPEVSGRDWFVFAVSLVPFIYGWVIWIGYTSDILTAIVEVDRLAKPPTRARRMMLLTNVAFIYIITLMQNAALYASVARVDRDAFVGIDSSNISNIARILLSLFLAVETIAALGTGAIFANPASGSGFVPIGLTSVQSLLFLGIIIAKLAALVALGQEERLILQLIKEVKKDEGGAVRDVNQIKIE